MPKSPDSYLKLLKETEQLTKPLREIREEGKENGDQDAVYKYGQKLYGKTDWHSGYEAAYGRFMKKTNLLEALKTRREWFEAGYQKAMDDMWRLMKKKRREVFR